MPFIRNTAISRNLPIALSLVMGLSAVACGHSRRKQTQQLRGVTTRIHRIKLVGVERFKKDEFLSYLNVGESSRLWFGTRYYFRDAVLELDRNRIVELYHAHGYYRAKVVSIEVQRHRRRDRVNLVVTVDEGPSTKITDIDFSWPAGLPSGPSAESVASATIKKVGLKAGDRFDEPGLDAAAQRLRAAIRARGYPFAKVEPKASVNRDRQRAKVAFAITPGPYATIGPIEIDGLVGVPKYLVRNEIDDLRGKPYSPARVKQVEKSVYALDVFQVVNVTEAPELKSDGTLPLKVSVRESKTQSIKLGVGLGVETNRWEQRGTAVYTHRNLFGHLTRLDLRMIGGYAELPHPFAPVAHGPIFKFLPRLRKKGLLERRLVWTWEPGFELGINEGYQFFSPTNRIGVSRFFFRFMEVGVSHNLRYVNFFNLLPEFDSQLSLLGLDFRDPYLLSYLSFVNNFYFTDEIVNPNNGTVFGVTYDLAGLGGDYDYHKITPNLRVYWRIIEHIQLAGRVELGIIRPYGDKPGAPFDLKYYLGGTNSVRGWGFRRLSPKIELADENGVLRSIPVGGNSMFTASLEARFKIVGPLHLVGFYDVGDVREQLSEFVPSEWNHAVGPGLRLNTPIGVFRFDVGVRIGDTPLSVGEPRAAFHFGLGESF